MADDEDRRRAGPADELLGRVGVPGERVDVVGRLLREPVAEAVEGERRPLRPQGEQVAPVVGARREAVQEEQQRALAVAPLDEQPAAADLLDLAAASRQLSTRSVSTAEPTPACPPD